MTAPNFDDAFEMMRFYLEDWGLLELQDVVREMLLDGVSPDVATLRLRETDAFKQRFRMNEERRKNGLPVLSPAEIVELERQYAGILRRAGFPPGFYDSPDDFVFWGGHDMSPDELSDRVQRAREEWLDAPEEERELWTRFYGGPGDAMAMFLDPTRAEPLIEQRARAVRIAAEAERAFGDQFQLSRERAEELERLGVTQQQARRGYQELAATSQRDQFLARLSGRELSFAEQEAAAVLEDQQARQRIERVRAEERGRFRENYLAQQTGLRRESGGSY